MIFAYFDERLASLPFLCVDGVVEGGLNLSNRPGNRTPAHLRADTTTEMALKLVRDPGRAEWLHGVTVVTNNHLDTDGLLAIWAILNPEQALRHEREIVQCARAGDFGEFASPEAFKFDAVVRAFDDDRLSPIAPEVRGREGHARYQLLYDRLLGMLPDLLGDAPRFKAIWAKPLQSVLGSLMRIHDVASVREYEAERLTVIETRESLDPVARFNTARHHRVLTATSSGPGFLYDMAFQAFSWFDTETPPRGTRVDLAEIAAAFDRREPSGGGRWVYTGNDSLDARLYRAGPGGDPVPSRLPLEMVEGELLGFFAGRP